MRDIDIGVTGPILPSVLDALGAGFRVHRLWEQPDRAAYLRTHGAALRGLATGASHGPIDGALFDLLPRLQVVAHYGVGYDTVDAAEAARRGIVVTNTPDVLTDDVADLAMGLLISAVRQLPRAEQHVRSGAWAKAKFAPGDTLRGRTVGILGLGRIGKAIATRCAAFGLAVGYHGRTEQAGVPWRYLPSVLELARASDVLILAAPGGPATRHVVDAAVLQALGPSGVLINVARGSLVDEAALIDALRTRVIRAAGLDVFEGEPNLRPGFLELDRAVLLPHVGSATVHSREAMGRLLVENLTSWFDGTGARTPVAESAAPA